MKKIIVVEVQSQYEGGHADSTFSNVSKARKYIENKESFKEWIDQNTTNEDGWGFYYIYNVFEIERGIVTGKLSA